MRMVWYGMVCYTITGNIYMHYRQKRIKKLNIKRGPCNSREWEHRGECMSSLVSLEEYMQEMKGKKLIEREKYMETMD